MSFFRTADPRQQGTGLAILRIVVGIIFAVHGGQKLFVYGLAGVAGAFGKMGIPMAGFMGPFVGCVEFLGGIALIVGLLTRLAALGLACDMLGAILFVHFKNGFFNPMGYEYPLTLLAANVALLIGGGGAVSADGAIAGRREP